MSSQVREEIASLEDKLFLKSAPSEEYGSLEALFGEVKRFIWSQWDYPDPRAYDLFTSWIVATYLLEEFQAVPYLFFLGPEDSGKTRGLEVITELAYRGMLIPSVGPAPIFRLDNMFHPTFCLDESEYVSKDKLELVGILNQRYRRGAGVPRLRPTRSGDFEVEVFRVFGFTAFAGTRDLLRTLKSRCIVFGMSPANREVNRFIDKEEGQHLRNKLTNLRSVFLTSRSEDQVNCLEKLGMMNALKALKTFPELASLRGRLFELFCPLVQVAPPESRQTIIEFAHDLDKERREEAETDDDAQVLYAIIEQHDLQNTEIVKLTDIASRVNEGRAPRECLTNQEVGYTIRRLGFKRKRVTGGVTAVIFNQITADRLKRRYAESQPVLDNSSNPPNPSLSIEQAKKSEEDASD